MEAKSCPSCCFQKRFLGSGSQSEIPAGEQRMKTKSGFGSQSTQVLPIAGKKNEFIFMGDRWIPDNLAESRHIWLPIEWEKGNPVIKWYPNWNLSNLQ